MFPWMEFVLRVIAIGVGATLLLDLWQLVLKTLKVPTLNFAYVGRWVGHWRHGQWAHTAIAKAAPIQGERLLGWAVHYATGLVFAALLLGLCGMEWARAPHLLPAVLFGMVTVAAPLLVMQPAMGAGIASSKTPTPLFNCLKSVINHIVFGLGLYVAAVATALWY